MQALNNINLDSLIDTVVSLSAAFILGGLIGFERQFRQRTAGLRTNVLVAVDTDAHALAAQSSAAAAAQGSLKTMQRRYQLGAASHVEVLIAAQQAERAQLAVIAARADRLANSAAFYVAMGGGPVPAEVTE